MKTLPPFHAQVYRVMPEDFSASVEVAACYIEIGDKFLLLKRASHKPQGNTWGVPAGKLEEGETAHQAVIREIFEETGLHVNMDNLNYLAPFYVRYPDIDFVYHMFHVALEITPAVKLSSDEHVDFRWTSPAEAMELPLISGGIEVLHHFKALSKKEPIQRKDFFFIRHGETDVNANPSIKRVDYDLPLNARGRTQALSMREAVANYSFKSVCYSPIQRAVETKELLVDGLTMNHHPVEGLSECKADIWTKMVCLEEGKGYDVCDEVANFLKRVWDGIHISLEQDSPTLIVAHGGVHWALCYLMNIAKHPWKIGNCELVHFAPIGSSEWNAKIIK